MARMPARLSVGGWHWDNLLVADHGQPDYWRAHCRFRTFKLEPDIMLRPLFSDYHNRLSRHVPEDSPNLRPCSVEETDALKPVFSS